MRKEFCCAVPHYVYIRTYIYVARHYMEKLFAQRHTTYIYVRIYSYRGTAEEILNLYGMIPLHWSYFRTFFECFECSY